jgi:hypothetical protein
VLNENLNKYIYITELNDALFLQLAKLSKYRLHWLDIRVRMNEQQVRKCTHTVTIMVPEFDLWLLSIVEEFPGCVFPTQLFARAEMHAYLHVMYPSNFMKIHSAT